MARTDPHFRLRIPEHVKLVVERSAAANHRSINSEVVARLEETLRSPRASRYLERINSELDRLVQTIEAYSALADAYAELHESYRDATKDQISSLEIDRAEHLVKHCRSIVDAYTPHGDDSTDDLFSVVEETGSS